MTEARQPTTRYKTTNWSQYNAALKARGQARRGAGWHGMYNAALKARGSLTVWLQPDMEWLGLHLPANEAVSKHFQMPASSFV